MSTLIGQINQLNKMNERELELGLVNTTGSWHEEFKSSAYIHVSGLPYKLTEGDILQVFSGFGEIIDLNLVRDSETGKSCGFCFLAYEDQRSTVLAVDNLNGFEVLGRKIKVTHTKRYYRKIEKGERRQKFGVGIPTLLMDLYGKEFFEKTSAESKRKKEKKMRKSNMTRRERKEYKMEKRRKKEEKLRRKQEKRERKEQRRKEKQRRKERRKMKNILSPEELEKKKMRMEKKKNRDYERRKLLHETGIEGGQDVDFLQHQKDSSYNMAYKYGSKMNLHETQFDLTDLKVYQYQKQQEESEKYKREKIEKEMRVKNRNADRREEQLKRDLERRRREYENQKRRKNRDGEEEDSTRLKKRRRRGDSYVDEVPNSGGRISKKRKLD